MGCFLSVSFYFVWGDTLTCRRTYTHTHTLAAHEQATPFSFLLFTGRALALLGVAEGWLCAGRVEWRDLRLQNLRFVDVTVNPSDSCDFEKAYFLVGKKNWVTVCAGKRSRKRLLFNLFNPMRQMDFFFGLNLLNLLYRHRWRLVLQTIKYAVVKMCKAQCWMDNAHSKLGQNTAKTLLKLLLFAFSG